MERVSLGIILDGAPACKVKSRKLLTALSIVAKYGFILSFIGFLFFIIIAVVRDSGKLFDSSIGFLFGSLFLFLCRFLWDEKRRCPYCGHFFSMKRISENQLISASQRTVFRNVDDHHSGMAYDFSGNIAFVSGKTTRQEQGTETTRKYTYNMRCSCCGCVNKVEEEKTTKQF